MHLLYYRRNSGPESTESQSSYVARAGLEPRRSALSTKVYKKMWRKGIRLKQFPWCLRKLWWVISYHLSFKLFSSFILSHCCDNSWRYGSFIHSTKSSGTYCMSRNVVGTANMSLNKTPCLVLGCICLQSTKGESQILLALLPQRVFRIPPSLPKDAPEAKAIL